MELILLAAKLPLREQANAVTAALYSGGVTHGQLLAGFIVQLLANGSESNTALLTQAIIDGQNGALSSNAKQALLFGLFNDLRADAAAPDRLFELFVELTTRYFLDE